MVIVRVNTINGNELSIPDGYKKSKVGIIPEDWKIKKFKDITTILKCGIASTPTYVEDGVPFLSSQNVKENKIVLDKYKFVSNEFHKKLTKNAKPQRGDILYTRVGASFGKAAVVDFDWEFSVYVSLTLIRMKESYNNYFYSYLLNSDKYVFNAQKTVFQGGGVQNLNVKEVEKFDMVVPPIKEQNKIAEILLTWDKAIELKEKLIEKKKDQKEGLLQKLMNGEIRLPGFVDKWKEVKLGEIFELSTGKSKSRYIEPKGKFIIVDMGGVSTEGSLISKKETNHGSDMLTYGDLVMVKDDIGGGNIIGKVVFIDKNDRYILGDHVYKLTNLTGDSEFLSYLINSRIVNNDFRKKANGTAQLGLGRKDVESQVLRVPVYEEQKAIAKILSTIDNEIELLNKETSEIKQQKKGLMQLLLTGEVRVKA